MRTPDTARARVTYKFSFSENVHLCRDGVRQLAHFAYPAATMLACTAVSVGPTGTRDDRALVQGAGAQSGHDGPGAAGRRHLHRDVTVATGPILSCEVRLQRPFVFGFRMRASSASTPKPH